MKYIALLLFMLCNLSCNKNNYLEKELTKKKNCWVLVGNYTEVSSINKEMYGGNRFLANGDVQDLLIINGLEQKKFNFESKTINNKWNIDRNGFLSFYDYHFKIINISNDTLIVENLKLKSKLIFINMPPVTRKVP
jgi:hypothetical protein